MHSRSMRPRPPHCLMRAWKRKKGVCLGTLAKCLSFDAFLQCVLLVSSLIIDRVGRFSGPWWPERTAVARGYGYGVEVDMDTDTVVFGDTSAVDEKFT